MGNAAAARDRGDYDEARRTLEMVVERFPDYEEAQAELEQLPG